MISQQMYGTIRLSNHASELGRRFKVIAKRLISEYLTLKTNVKDIEHLAKIRLPVSSFRLAMLTPRKGSIYTDKRRNATQTYMSFRDVHSRNMRDLHLDDYNKTRSNARISYSKPIYDFLSDDSSNVYPLYHHFRDK